jgi:hypothetical protein
MTICARKTWPLDRDDDYFYYVETVAKGNSLGEFEQIVLVALLCLDPDAYGMAVRREIEERTGRRVSIGAVYATLERLESKGYASSCAGSQLRSAAAAPNGSFV